MSEIRPEGVDPDCMHVAFRAQWHQDIEGQASKGLPIHAGLLPGQHGESENQLIWEYQIDST